MASTCAINAPSEALSPLPFPRIGAVGREFHVDEGHHGRTPQSSLSSSTVVEHSSPGPRETRDAETAIHSPRPPGAVPLGLQLFFWAVLLFALVATAVSLEGMLWWNTRRQGWDVPSWWEPDNFQWRAYFMRSLPLGGAMALSLLWGMAQDAILRLQPLVNLTGDQAKGSAERTVLLDYNGNGFVASWTAWRNSDYMIVLWIATTLLTTSLKPLSGAMLSVRDVWWLYPTQTVARVTKVSQDVGDQFEDIIAFQGASGFATARVLFDIGPAPFVTEDGHTVEAFELPTGQNGTAYANVTAVFNRAVCVSPTTFQMDNDAGTMVWHNTAWFDDCRFSFTVTNDSSNLFGVETLPDLAECSNFTGTAPQHRPVVFWFFSYEPEPFFSAVQCTPQVSVSDVRVAIDLASNTTTLVAVNETTTSTIGSVGYLPYNGLFFDNVTLDSTAMSRLESVQEQLPSAVFQAAKAKDPSLRNTFVYYGFTNITAEIYNTYLSLIARSLYFVPSEEPVLVQVGANCKRLILVPIAVHALAAVLTVLAIYGAVMSVVHCRLRRRFTIPEHYGTIATGFLLSQPATDDSDADPDAKASASSLCSALQQAARAEEGIPRALADCRFAIDVRTGRLGMTRVPHVRSPESLRERVCAWLGRPWRALRTAAGAGEAETASTAGSACGRCGSPSTSTVATVV
ncbi:hypothetical protein C8T65DRAFT_739505 [Cerioporus squamosus]|nr:hypothetical protein C8T65DRAFT_739505 [Cerioporus squamosus]